MTAANAVNKNSKRIVAWLDNHPKAITILHTARRRARERNCNWCVVYVQTPSRLPMLEDDIGEHMLRLCTLAEQMGAEVVHLQANQVEIGLTEFFEAEKERIELFIIGSPETNKTLSRFRLRCTAWERAVHIAGQYARIEIIPLSGMSIGKLHWNWRNLRFPHPINMAYAVAAVGVAYLVSRCMEWVMPPALFRINIQNIDLLFMVACAFAASRYGLLSGLTAAAAGSLTYTYVYMPPYNTLHFTSITELLNMTIFLSAGILIALFTSRARSYAESVAKRERATQALFTLYRIASTAFSRQQALETLQRKLSQMLDVEVAFFLPPAINPDGIEPIMPAQVTLEDPDQRALESCWTEMKTTGLASPLHTHASWRFEPMMAPGGKIGVLAVRPKSGRGFDVWLGYLLANIADQTAVLIEHIEMERSMEATRLREEREKLRSMLLSSVSHDLKTPLAGIIGGLSVYRSVGDRLTPQKRSELLESAFEEAQRLDSFITNILDMTRLESGKIDFHPEWHTMPELIQQVAKRIQHRLRNRPLLVHPCPKDIEIYMDVMMTGQVLQNLLDNACKYTPDGTKIEIHCSIDDINGFLCRVRDYGPGIPEDKLGQVFDKYARLQKEDSQVAGTGLGLAICKAAIETQGGWITVTNHSEGGTEFTFCLPKWRKIQSISTVEEVA
jgi:two-component system sensor histidine kinase KdpD